MCECERKYGLPRAYTRVGKRVREEETTRERRRKCMCELRNTARAGRYSAAAVCCDDESFLDLRRVRGGNLSPCG